MDALLERAPCVLWNDAVDAFDRFMDGALRPHEAGEVLLRAMQHREAEGGVLLSLADALAPTAADMLHLDPAWLLWSS